MFMPRVFDMPCAGLMVLGKIDLCRVPNGKHTAKSLAHGIARGSGSDYEKWASMI